MQHIRIRYDDMPGIPNSRPHRRRRIAVVGMRLNIDFHYISELLQFSDLILRKRLRREHVQRSAVIILQHRLQHRQVVAHRLA
ncbi:hypothetical protein D3C84_805440 [compost metagenome]